MKRYIYTLALICLPLSAQVIRIPPRSTVAGLPAPSSALKGRIWAVTDALTPSDCTAGHGTAVALCQDTGVVWQAAPQGPAGATGAQGPTGAAGAQGSTGSIGPQGATGPAGATGAAGTTGATGAQGPQGPTGSAGATGAAASVSVGSVTTGTAGSSAAIANSGTSAAAVFDFTIPRGDTGATGATGPTGPAGAAGPAPSGAANLFLATPNGSSGVSALRAIVAADIPPLNQSTTGGAATLSTPRLIYGNNFDGSAALAQIIASIYGGTGNGFTKFSGPASTEKTFTLPNASAVILTDAAAVTVAQGGTGVTTLAAHGVVVGNGVSAVNVAGAGSAGQVLTSNGAAADPTFQAASGGLLNPLAAGSVGTNALQVVQTGTGLYQPAANVLGVAANGIDAMRFETAISGVNYLDVIPSATGGGSANGPTIKATGADSSVDLNFDTKGTGSRYQWKINGTTKADFTDMGGGDWRLRLTAGSLSVAGGAVLPSSFNGLIFNNDAGLYRVSSKVIAFSDGGQNTNGWPQWAGSKFLAANGTNTTATLATTGLSVTVTLGRKYIVDCHLRVANSVAAEGVQVDFGGGTAAATDFRVEVKFTDATLVKAQQTTALATAVSVATFTGDGEIAIHGSFEPSASGTFIPRYAENSHATGTATIYRGSDCVLQDAP